jgi:multiple sugar transport system permease protein
MAASFGMARSRQRMTGWQMVWLIVMIGISVITVLPFVFMASTSFTESYTIMSYPPKLIPPNPTLKNYNTLLFEFQDGLFLRWFFNSVVTTTAITVGSVLLNTLSGYLFAKKQFFGRELIFALILSTLMVPGAVTLIPSFQVVRWLGLYDTYGALIVPGLAGAVGIFMMRQFIESLPSDLENAARLDGCSEFQIFRRVILPLMKPGLVVLGVFTFMTQWTSYLWPLVISTREEMLTLTVGVQSLRSLFTVNWGVLSAGAVLSLLPLILVFLFTQRYFIRGVAMTGLKG